MASVRAVGKVEVYSLTKADFDNLSLRENVAWSRRWDEEDTRERGALGGVKRPARQARGQGAPALPHPHGARDLGNWRHH